jgi:hypothetical protein
MNAAILAACATGARNSQTQTHAGYPVMHLTKDFDVYYNVVFRKYYHFESHTLVKPMAPVEISPISTEITPTSMSIVHTEPKSLAMQHTFAVSPQKEDGPGLVRYLKHDLQKYIEWNIDRFTTSNVWCTSDLEIEKLYKDFIKNTYGISLETRLQDLNYTTQFCYEIELETSGVKTCIQSY